MSLLSSAHTLVHTHTANQNLYIPPLQDQRREIEIQNQSSAHTYWELEPYYDHCSGAVEGTAVVDAKVSTHRMHYCMYNIWLCCQ